MRKGAFHTLASFSLRWGASADRESDIAHLKRLHEPLMWEVKNGIGHNGMDWQR